MTRGSSTDKRADRTYLREVAYAEPSGLAARSALYEYQQPRIDLVSEVASCLGAVTGHRIADVGCGNGRYLSMLVAAGAQVIGADLSTGMLAAIPAPRPALVGADAQALPFVAGSFDDVLLMHMLYHVPRPERAVSEAARAFREGWSVSRGYQWARAPRRNERGSGFRCSTRRGLATDLRDLGLVNPRVDANDARTLLKAAFGELEEIQLRSRSS